MALSFDKSNLTIGCLIHVYNRGNNKMVLFKSSADYQWFTKKMVKLKMRDEFELIAYCLMPNHFHFFLRTKKDCGLSRFFQRLQLAYAKYFNRKYSHLGHVFGGSFKTGALSDDHHVAELPRYIHLNPVNAGLTSRPGSWLYSNYNDIISGEIKPEDSFYDEVYGGARLYQDFVESQLSPNQLSMSGANQVGFKNRG